MPRPARRRAILLPAVLVLAVLLGAGGAAIGFALTGQPAKTNDTSLHATATVGQITPNSPAPAQSTASSPTEANNQLQADVSTVNTALANYRAQVKNCSTISCASGPNSSVGAAIDTFAGQVRAISMPTSQASADAANLASAASHLASLYSALAAATTNNQYNNIASGIQPATNQVDQDLTTLTKVLTGS